MPVHTHTHAHTHTPLPHMCGVVSPASVWVDHVSALHCSHGPPEHSLHAPHTQLLHGSLVTPATPTWSTVQPCQLHAAMHSLSNPNSVQRGLLDMCRNRSMLSARVRISCLNDMSRRRNCLLLLYLSRNWHAHHQTSPYQTSPHPIPSSTTAPSHAAPRSPLLPARPCTWLPWMSPTPHHTPSFSTCAARACLRAPRRSSIAQQVSCLSPDLT